MNAPATPPKPGARINCDGTIAATPGGVVLASADHMHTDEFIHDFIHGDRRIEIAVRFRVSVDDIHIPLQVMATREGELVSHALPYGAFSSLRDLVESVLVSRGNRIMPEAETQDI